MSYATKEQLEAIKEGDDVTLFPAGCYSKATIHKVVRVTKTQIIIHPYNLDQRYSRETGYIRGDSSGYGGRDRIAPANENDIEQIKRRMLIETLTDLKEHKLKELPTKTLEKAVNLLVP